MQFIRRTLTSSHAGALEEGKPGSGGDVAHLK